MVLPKSLLLFTGSLPLVTGKVLWSDSPGDYGDFIKTAFPLGNGRLGAMPVGSYGKEIVNLNVDSLWRGGPFEDPFYSGGNPNTSKADALGPIRDFIFQNGTGPMDELLGEFPAYGSYQVLGNLTIDLGNLGDVHSYRRSLDLRSGLYSDQFVEGAMLYEREAFCSFPDQVCVYHLSSNSTLPAVSIGLENQVVTPKPTTLCKDDSLILHGQTAPSIGMIYHAQATVLVRGRRQPICNTTTLTIPAGTKEITIVLGADTNYDSSKGTAAAGYTFRGADPANNVQKTTARAAKKSHTALQKTHLRDFHSVADNFILSLPDPHDSEKKPTTAVLADYRQPGDPFVENLLFDYARYLFISSSRPGALPPNLQGLWTEQASPAWSADYHANINLQMNHWAVGQVGLGELTEPLWRYMADTWLPRGAETARLLYGAEEGWVTHNEMNVFGHTAMKNDAGWANYPAVNAWMAQHVWDHFDHTQDVSWYRRTGYPILKGAAQFWLSQLVKDEYSNDGTWVVNPCNSPEHGPTTFGCTNYQQLIWELFDHVLRGWDASGDTDQAFRRAISDKLSHLDTGIHIGAWGQIQEWKLDLDVRNDTHRHLSNLHGWYPGYALHTHENGTQLADAVATTLRSRGTGVDDQNTGWGKVWRAACWALLNETETAYEHLTLAAQNNFASNGLSMYGGNAPFQIDANFGMLGAMVAMLVRDLDRSSADGSGEQVVALGPAIPAAWGGGSVEGLRLRGGGTVRFSWDDAGTVTSCRANLSRRAASAPVVFVVGEDVIRC